MMALTVPARAQRGQAMVEMAAMIGVVTLLFLGIWYLGKFHDIQASTIQAARYSAWERTVHSKAQMSDTQLERQTRARLFTYNQNPYRANDSRANGQAWGAQSPNWQAHGGGTRLVNRPDDVTVRTRSEALPGLAASSFTRALGGITRITGALSGGEALPAGGLQSSTVTVAVNNVASLPAPLNALNLRLSESSALVINSWDANGPRQAARRTEPFAPGSVLADVNRVLAPLRIAISLLEPDFREFLPGQICPDIVPNDRVSGNNNLPAYGGARPCY